MIVLSGADIVLPDRVLTGNSIVIRDGFIEEVMPSGLRGDPRAETIDLSGRIICPGFIDVHVHGIEGIDVLDGPDAVATVATRLPKYGVTAFCPTSVACAPRAPCRHFSLPLVRRALRMRRARRACCRRISKAIF